MNKYTEFISKTLMSKYGFIVENYALNFDNTQKAMLLKYMEDGVYAIIFTHASDEYQSLSSAREYLNNKNMNYNLNTIVYVDGDNFISFNDTQSKRVVIDLRSKSILSSNVSSDALLSTARDALNQKDTMNILFDLLPSLHKKSREIPVTFTLMAINILMFLVSAFLSGNLSNINVNVLVFLGAKYNPAIEAGQFYRFLTSTFLHGGLLHIAFNMYSLYVLGPTVEKLYGRYRYITIYLIAGAVGSILSFLFSNSISVGASGSIFGLFGASLIFSLKLRDIINKSFLYNIIGVIFINLTLGFSSSEIDNLGHIGGLIGGALLSLILFDKNQILTNLRKKL